MDYAVIRVGGKQHRVRDGETLVVDRVRTAEGETFEPDVLLGDDGVKVTLKVVSHERGPKLRIGKYRKRTGYKRHTGFRAATSRIEVSLGGAKRAATKTAPKKEAAPEAPDAEATPAAEPTPAGLPEGYEAMTVAAIGKAAKDWSRAELEAALAYEQGHASRKGALSALEHALAAEEEA